MANVSTTEVNILVSVLDQLSEQTSAFVRLQGTYKGLKNFFN